MKHAEKGPVDIFIGGAGDRRFKALRRFFEDYRRDHPQRDARYFTWPQHGRIVDALRRAAGQGRRISVIGHSFGAHTAAKLLVRHAIRVDLLITVDPVSQFGRRVDPSPHAATWINITARPTRPDRTDVVAWLGSWRTRGAKSTLCIEHATFCRTVDANHAAFARMLRAKESTTRSALDFLLGL